MTGKIRAGAAGAPLCVRWTVGDVSPAGFEALRLSVHGAVRLLGDGPDYVVCVNTLSVVEARRRAGSLPSSVRWLQMERLVPECLAPHLDVSMGEGTAWKLVPPQLDSSVRELALDNDIVLWDLPEALVEWLEDRSGAARLIAEDVHPSHGQFAALCGPEPRNSGIRGTPAGFDLEGAVAAVLREHPVDIRSELDEQGLQIAALSRDADLLVVRTREVSICSPFPPHLPELGTCGAHFVGLNSRSIPWNFYGRPAIEARLEHWHRHRRELYERVGLPIPDEELAAAAAPFG